MRERKKKSFGFIENGLWKSKKRKPRNKKEEKPHLETGSRCWGGSIRSRRGKAVVGAGLPTSLLGPHERIPVPALWPQGDLSFLVRGEVPFSAFTTPFSW